MSGLNWKPLALADQAVIRAAFLHCQPGISEYTFTNLFIWAELRRILWTPWEEGLFFRGYHGHEPFFYPPTGFEDCRKAFEKLFELGRELNINTIRLVPEYQKKYAQNPGLHISADRDQFDYIYKAESLRTLKGWRLDGKRGFIKKFESQYHWAYSPYSHEWKDDCQKLFQSWLAARLEMDPSAVSEAVAFSRMLDHYEELQISGGVLSVEGQAAAFSFGEKLNETTFVVHFEKADPAYTGCYQMINREFARNSVPGEFLFINREQDMGLPGLRKAKQSYAPVRLMKKYTIQY